MVRNLLLVASIALGLMIGGCSKTDEPTSEKPEIENPSDGPEDGDGGEDDSEPAFGEVNDREYVNLGLPSKTKWATYNVGASTPSEFGTYFAWGEISPKSKYEGSTSITWQKKMNDIGGDPKYDAATANWGAPWRMPNLEEATELVEKCTWKWKTVNGHGGYEVMGPNGNSIFLPAAGFFVGKQVGGDGIHGNFWCSTPDPSNPNYPDNNAYTITINDNGKFGITNGARYYGMSVRPVIKNK